MSFGFSYLQFYISFKDNLMEVKESIPAYRRTLKKPTSHPKKTLQWLIWSALIVVICSLGIAFVYQQWRHVILRREAVTLDRFHTVSEFQLTERDGKLFDSADQLKGKIWVADFFFTSCPGPCLKMNTCMQELQEAIKDKTDVRLVSFSVNPTTDTPEVLSRYAERFKAIPNRWFFLTGDRTKIYHLARESFMLGITDSNSKETKLTNGDFIHSTKLALVDRQGVIRGYYDSINSEIIPQLLTDIGNLMQEQPVN